MLPPPEKYIGKFVHGEKLDAQAILFYPNGEMYQGGIDAGQKHGKCVYKYFDGAVYTGLFKNEKKHGKG